MLKKDKEKRSRHTIYSHTPVQLIEKWCSITRVVVSSLNSRPLRRGERAQWYTGLSRQGQGCVNSSSQATAAVAASVLLQWLGSLGTNPGVPTSPSEPNTEILSVYSGKGFCGEQGSTILFGPFTICPPDTLFGVALPSSTPMGPVQGWPCCSRFLTPGEVEVGSVILASHQ